MTTNIIFLIAVVLGGLLAIYIFNLLINKKISKNLSDTDSVPVSVSVIKAAVFLSCGLLIAEIIPSFQTLLKIIPSQFQEDEILLKQVMYFSIFLGVILIILFVVHWFALLMYSIISQGKNLSIEISNNNLYAAIKFAGIILALTFAVKPGIFYLLDLLIPYPEMPIYY